jgi:hypothetical protein
VRGRNIMKTSNIRTVRLEGQLLKSVRGDIVHGGGGIRYRVKPH